MRLQFGLVVVLAATALAQPSQSDRYKYAPLVATAKLWNLIRYLHPRVTGDSTAWDAALMAAIPKIEAVHSDEELAVALDAMLETLHDPCTRIASGLPGKPISVQSFDADTMVIHAGNGDLAGSVGAGLMLTMGVPQSSNIVWDLRGARMPFTLSAARLDPRQLTMNGLGYAYRQHSGYANRGRYYSALQIVEAGPATAQGATRTRRAVYLIDKNSAVPVQAIVDQISGRTAILSEDPPSDQQAGVTELVNVLGKVVAEVRVGELRYSDGTTGFAPTRVVLNRGEEAVRAAAELANSGQWGMPGIRSDFGPGMAGFRDMPYSNDSYPAREMRILAAMRIWGIMHYFNPHIARLGDKWDDILVEFLEKFADAQDEHQYHRAVAEMAARSGDAGCYAASPEINSLFGSAVPAFEVRLIEGQPVVTQIYKKSPVQTGDVIVKYEGKPIEERIDQLSRYIAAPSPAALPGQIARILLNGAHDGLARCTVRGKDNSERDVAVEISASNRKAVAAHRLPVATRVINEHIGYADLERVDPAEVDVMFEKLRQVSAIIFDLRGFPTKAGPVVAARLLMKPQDDRKEPAVAELFRNVVGIGAGTGDRGHISLLESEVQMPRAAGERYTGKTVALIDEFSSAVSGQSALYFKAANGTVLIGSTTFPTFPEYSTAFDVPGGIRIAFSGEMVRWPNGKLVYPTGIQPDVEARPTLAGIRAGRDEVLEAAIAYLSHSSVRP